MSTKLTLTLDKEIIEQAKKYAKGENRSLSNIIENYLKLITKEQKNKNKKINPLIASLKGSFKAPKDLDYKKELEARLEKKWIRCFDPGLYLKQITNTSTHI